MHLVQRLSVATPDIVHQELLQTVDHLLQSIRRSTDVLNELQDVRDLLDSLPLATAEHGTATNRLRNANRYLVSHERGAAHYELQLLARSLRRQPGI